MKLVLIGNGFDIVHGLDTGYPSFKEYIRENDSDEYSFLATLFGDAFETDEFWWNFEESLARARFDNFADESEINIDYWRRNGFDEQDEKESLKLFFDEHINSLKLLFCKWVKRKNDEGLFEAHKNGSIESILKDAIILSFNYTSTVEELYDASCYHIHGFINDVDVENEYNLDSVVLGHGTSGCFITNEGDFISADDSFFVSDDGIEIPFEESNFIKNYDCSDDEIINDALSDADCSYQYIFSKRCKKIIREDPTSFFGNLEKYISSIDKVIVLGHSISGVDKPYYRKIADMLHEHDNNAVRWILSYHENKRTHLDNKAALTANISDICKISSVSFISMEWGIDTIRGICG